MRRFIMLTILGSVILSAPAPSAGDDLDAKRIIDLYDSATGSITSYDVFVNVTRQFFGISDPVGKTFRFLPPGEWPKPQRFAFRQVWRKNGWKRRYEEYDPEKSLKQWKQLCVYDGEVARCYTPALNQGSVLKPSPYPTEVGMEYYSMFRGIEGIADGPRLLRERLPHVTARRVPNSNLISIVAPAQVSNKKISCREQEYRVIVDPDRNCFPRVVEQLQQTPNGPELMTRLEVLDYLNREGGIAVPIRSKLTYFDINPGSQAYRKAYGAVETLVDVEKSRWDIDLPASLFTLPFPAGTEVTDMVQQVKYFSGKPDPSQNIADLVTHAQEVVPLREPLHPLPSPWWRDWRWLTGIALLLVATVLTIRYFRRRTRTA